MEKFKYLSLSVKNFVVCRIPSLLQTGRDGATTALFSYLTLYVSIAWEQLL